MAVRTWTLKIKGDEGDAIRAANKVERRFKRMDINRGFSGQLRKIRAGFGGLAASAAATGRKIARGLAIGVGIAAVAIGTGLITAFKGFEEHRKVMAKTSQVIKTMGASSWTSAGQVEALSDKMERLTGIDGDIIQNGANILLTFRNVRNEMGKGNDIYDKAVGLANDMSVALGQDMSNSSIQLGKALNDPIRGLTSMRRVGIQFTTQQEDQIKKMVEAGDIMGAQKIILGELSDQFGGAAEAAASPWSRLRAILLAWVDAVGEKIFPVVEKMATWLADKLPAAVDKAGQVFDAFKAGLTIEGIESGKGIFRIAQEIGSTAREAWPHVQRFGQVMADIGRAIAGFFKENPKVLFASLAAVIGGVLLFGVVALGAAVIAAVSPFVAFVAVLAVVAGAVTYAYTRWEWFRVAVDTVVDWFKTTALPAIRGFIDLVVQKFGELATWVRKIWPDIQEAISHVLTVVKVHIGAFVAVALALWDMFGTQILEYARTAWGAIRAHIDATLKIIRGVIQFVLALINGDWGKAWEAVRLILQGVWQSILAGIRLVLGVLKLILSAAWEAIKAAVRLHWNATWSIISGVWGRIKSTASGAINWVKDRMSSVMGVIKGAWDRAWGSIRDKVSSIWNGIKGAVRSGANAIIGVINWFIRLINKLPGVDIPQIDKIGGGGSAQQSGSSFGRERAMGGFMTNGPQYVVGEGSSAHPEAVIATDPRYRRRNQALVAWAADKLGMGVPGYQIGGIVDAAKGAVGGVAKAAGDWARDLSVKALGPVRNTAKSMIDKLPLGEHTWVGDFAKGVIDKFYNWAKGKTEEQEQAMALSGLVPSGSSLGGNPAANRLLGKKMSAGRGWGSQWGALDALVMSESGWNNTAQNPTSTAYGIGQFLDSTWATVGASKTSDPRTQIAAMLRYIAQRFGNPSAAWRFKQANNWYRNGGISEGGWTHPGEMVLRPADQKQLLKVVRGRGGGSDSGASITIEGDLVVQAETPAGGRAAAKAFVGELERRRVLTDARIS